MSESNHSDQLVSPPNAEVPAAWRVMHGEQGFIDTDKSIYSAGYITGLQEGDGGFQFDVLGEFSLWVTDADGADVNARAALLKVTNESGVTRYAVQGLHMGAQGARRAASSYVTITPGASLTIGRHGNSAARRAEDPTLVSAEAIWGQGFKFASSTSRRHLTLMADGERLGVEDTSTAGTHIMTNLLPKNSKNSDWIAQHTSLALRNAEREGLLDKTGELFAGRKVITRDTTIGGRNPEGTVDIRAHVAGDEAIVVDPEKDPEPYDALRNLFIQKVRDVAQWGPNQYPTEEDILAAVQQTIRESMQYDLEYANAVSAEQMANGGGARKVNLSRYLWDGKGVCRHMALAAAWLGGEAAEYGLLPGRMTAEVNQRVSDNSAHEWARYTAPDGRVYIVDPTPGGYVGLLEGSINSGWNYFREGEREEYLQRARVHKLGRLAGVGK